MLSCSDFNNDPGSEIYAPLPRLPGFHSPPLLSRVPSLIPLSPSSPTSSFSLPPSCPLHVPLLSPWALSILRPPVVFPVLFSCPNHYPLNIARRFGRALSAPPVGPDEALPQKHFQAEIGTTLSLA